MYLLDCDSTIKPIIILAGYVILLIQIGIPILLIIFGSIDLGKAVIASKEDEVKKAKKTFINRLIYAVAVFLVVWIVKAILGFVPKLFAGEDLGTSNYEGCWSCVASRGQNTEKCKWVE